MNRKIDNPSPRTVTGGNWALALTGEVNLDTLSSDGSEEEIRDSGRSFQSLIVWGRSYACVPGSTNGIPISFKVLPMVPLVIPLVPMVMPMVPLALYPHQVGDTNLLQSEKFCLQTLLPKLTPNHFPVL